MQQTSNFWIKRNALWVIYKQNIAKQNKATTKNIDYNKNNSDATTKQLNMQYYTTIHWMELCYTTS